MPKPAPASVPSTTLMCQAGIALEEQAAHLRTQRAHQAALVDTERVAGWDSWDIPSSHSSHRFFGVDDEGYAVLAPRSASNALTLSEILTLVSKGNSPQ